MQWHQLDHIQTICTSLQTDNHASTPSLNFYRLDALPDAQPTVAINSNKISKASQAGQAVLMLDTAGHDHYL